MKSKILIFIVITLLDILPSNLFCQYREAETFLEGFEGTGVYIDTTGISHLLEYCGNFSGRVYATKGFILYIKDNIFNETKLQNDTFDISSIKPEFSNKKEQFEIIKEKIGNFYFKKHSNFTDEIDKYKLFSTTFLELQNVDTIKSYFKNISNYDLEFDNYPTFPVYIPNERTLNPSSKPVDIQYQNIDTYYDMNFHKLGFGWNIYSLNLPLAWEISTGNRETVLSVYDRFGISNIFHPDLPVKTLATDNIGNWIYLNTNDGNFGDSDFGFNNNIPINTYLPDRAFQGKYGDHGLTVLSMAMAKRNNDNLLQPAEGGLVGTCPDCLGIAFYSQNQNRGTDT